MTPPCGPSEIATPSALPDLGSDSRALLGRLGERDVAHVRDARLDDAGEADADQPALGARRALALAQLRVAGQLQRGVEAGGVVAGVEHGAGGGAVGHAAAGTRLRRASSAGSSPRRPRGDRHRALEREVQLRPAEAAVEPGRAAVRDHDAAAHRQVLHVIGARQAAVHAVERGRLGRAHVRADVVDQVEAQAQQAPSALNPASTSVSALGRDRGGEQVLARGPRSSAPACRAARETTASSTT